MKKILLLSTVFISILFIYKPADAQFQANINIGVQPAWGPSGYDYAENYYLPDVEAYYSVPRRQFVYFDNGNWVYSSSLPGRCGSYDLYSGYKVVMNEHNPWFHFNDDRVQYAPYRFRHDQVVIRDGRNYGRGGYGRRVFNDRGSPRDWGYDRRGNDRRQGWGHDNGCHGEYDNDREHDDDHEGREHVRW
ncbi:MAG: hypothetical protein NVSMB63_18840 [Sediminibacterium sp.]